MFFECWNSVKPSKNIYMPFTIKSHLAKKLRKQSKKSLVSNRIGWIIIWPQCYWERPCTDLASEVFTSSRQSICGMTLWLFLMCLLKLTFEVTLVTLKTFIIMAECFKINLITIKRFWFSFQIIFLSPGISSYSRGT